LKVVITTSLTTTEVVNYMYFNNYPSHELTTDQLCNGPFHGIVASPKKRLQKPTH